MQSAVAGRTGPRWILRGRAAALWVAMTAIAAPAVAEDLPEIVALEMAGGPERLRLSVSVSETVPFHVELPRGSRRLRIDLPPVSATPDLCGALAASPHIAACAAGRLIFGYYRIAVTLSFCGVVDQAVMEAAMAGLPARLHVDIAGTPLARCE